MEKSISTGDVFLVHSQTFLGKSIQWFMKLWGKQKNYDTSWVANHAGTFLLDDPLRIGESSDNGYRINVFHKQYKLDKVSYVVITPKFAYTPEELKKVKDYIFELQTVSQTYQYWALIQWMVLVLTFGKIDLFGKGRNRGITFCYESTARIIQNVRPKHINWDVERTDFYNLYNNPYFEIKIDKRS